MDFHSWVDWGLFFDYIIYSPYLCLMTKYYLEVVKNNVSICLDTDVQYHHEFNIGDIILVEYDIKGKTTLIFDVMSMSYSITFGAEFIIDWDKTCSMRLSIAGCITKGYMVDVTKNVQREEKLKTLGI